MKQIRTNGNIIVNEIKIGDIHFECEYGIAIKSEVVTEPKINSEGNWIWKSKELKTGKIIDYLVNPDYPKYAVNLYDYNAYEKIEKL